jgi:hypothetical protein
MSAPGPMTVAIPGPSVAPSTAAGVIAQQAANAQAQILADGAGAYQAPASLLPDLAKAIAAAFPELKGRAVAVSDWHITAENVPKTLPVCMLQFVHEDTEWPQRSNARALMHEFAQIKFILKSARALRKDGSESPFWSFYDYDRIRNSFYAVLHRYRSPHNERVVPVRMDMGADQLAVEITFTVKHTYYWCAPPASDGGDQPLMNIGGIQFDAVLEPHIIDPSCCACVPAAPVTPSC